MPPCTIYITYLTNDNDKNFILLIHIKGGNISFPFINNNENVGNDDYDKVYLYYDNLMYIYNDPKKVHSINWSFAMTRFTFHGLPDSLTSLVQFACFCYSAWTRIVFCILIGKEL